MLTREAFVKDHFLQCFPGKEEYDQYQIGLKYCNVYRQLMVFFMSFKDDCEFRDVLKIIMSLSFQVSLMERIDMMVVRCGYKLIDTENCTYILGNANDDSLDEEDENFYREYYDGFTVMLNDKEFYIAHLHLCDDWIKETRCDRKIDHLYRMESFRILSICIVWVSFCVYDYNYNFLYPYAYNDQDLFLYMVLCIANPLRLFF